MVNWGGGRDSMPDGAASVVFVEASIGADGLPVSARALGGAKALRPAAVGYVRQWRFAPAAADGAPVAPKSVVAVPFLRAGKGAPRPCARSLSLEILHRAPEPVSIRPNGVPGYFTHDPYGVR